MIELRYVDALPIVEIVAALAGLAEAAIVLILMTAHASGRGAKKSLVQVFNFDQCASRGSNVFRRMTAIAGQPAMFAFKRVSSLAMVEGIAVPLNDREVFPVMLGVTADAIFAQAWADVIAGVQSLSRSQS